LIKDLWNPHKIDSARVWRNLFRVTRDVPNIHLLRKACRAHGVKSLSVYGSRAQGLAHPESDLDLLVEFHRDSPDGAFDQFCGLKEELEEIFSVKVDLMVDRPFRNKHFQESVNASKRLIVRL
jgi:hypothetical protein